MYRGRLVHFYKRAQILAGDLWAAYGGASRRNNSSDTVGAVVGLGGSSSSCATISGSNGGTNIYDFTDIDQLTMFADYRYDTLYTCILLFIQF